MNLKNIVFFSVLMVATLIGISQVEIAKPDFIKKSVRFHGSLGLSSSYYTATNITARRPGSVVRMNYNSKLEVGRYFKMPLQISMSTLPVHFGSFAQQKAFNTFTVSDFIENPVNTIRTGIEYKSFKLDLGTNSSQYSKLTMSGLPMFGAGITWNPGVLILQANYGVSAHAIERDSINFIAGQFRRIMQSVKFGLGNVNKSYFALNVVQGKDDIGSVTSIDSTVNSQQGLVVSLDFALQFSKTVKWKSELAGSLYTQDGKSTEIDASDLNIGAIDFLVENVMPLRVSTFADFALQSELMQSYKNWSLGLKGEYIGAGFRTMGQPFLQPDRLDLTVNPSMKLFKNKVNFSLNGGYRLNNLSGTKGATMNQIIAATSLTVNATKGLSLSFNYSNFGVENDQIGDTLRIKNTTQSFGFSPSYTKEGKHGSNTFGLSSSYNDFKDFNVVSGSLSSNASTVFSGNYNRSFNKYPLTLGASLSQFDMTSSLFEVHTTNASLITGYSFFKKTLRANLTSTYSINRSAAPDSDNQLTFRLSVDYTTPFKMNINLSASNNEYNYGATSGLSFYRENLIQLGITQKF